MQINEHALAEAIRDGGMPTWELAGRVGVDVAELVSMKDLGRLPLGVLIRLAEILDLPLARLFEDGSDVLQHNDDLSIVGACLGALPEGLTRDTLARALAWDLERVETALGHLNVALCAVGMRLGVDGNRIRVLGVIGRVGPVTRAVLERSVPGDGRVAPEIARAVWSAVFAQDARLLGTGEGIIGASRRRFVVYEGRHTPASPPVAFSLMLEESAG